MTAPVDELNAWATALTHEISKTQAEISSLQGKLAELQGKKAAIEYLTGTSKNGQHDLPPVFGPVIS